MIRVVDQKLCCGCGACSQSCPKNSILMLQDYEGFSYPHVDEETCIDCGKCEKVCPISQKEDSHSILNVSAVINPNEDIRRYSSSGGVFTMLAERVICDGGVVFGAKWNNDWKVEHSFVDNNEGLDAFRSSKYVQSDINSCYLKAESFLKTGRKVLFSGTPCQIAGLKHYLQKEYENLLTVECACHGVPSPGLWQQYLDEISKGKRLASVNHRDKCTGWHNYSVVIRFADGSSVSQAHDDNPWTRAFIKNLTLRPSCYSCKFKCNTSCSDLTIADLWGDKFLLNDHYDDKGTSLVISHTQKGNELMTVISEINMLSLEDVIRYNSSLITPATPHLKRENFFSLIHSGKPFIKTVSCITRDPLLLRIKLFLRKNLIFCRR